MEQTRDKLYIFLIYAVLALATIVAFSEVRRARFINLDDGAYVTKNQNVRYGLTCESFIWAFTGTHSGNWHPLTSLSHIVDCELFA